MVVVVVEEMSFAKAGVIKTSSTLIVNVDT